MFSKHLLYMLGMTPLAFGHGYVRSIIADGTTYPGYIPMVDGLFKENGLKRVMWGFTKQNTFGVGPVIDVTSPDITCRAGATPADITAPARAGANIVFNWSNYFKSHKGPVLTYMAPLTKADAKPQELNFFKIDEAGYDQKTHVWASDRMMAQNHSWTVTIPSDIKPGKYVVRHELIALQFASDGNPQGPGTVTAGAQFYPICLNVEVTGTGTQTPAGVKFPGGYSPSEPGIIYDLFDGPNFYLPPGPPLYAGKHDAPVGPAPVVKDTGVLAGPTASAYLEALALAEKEFNTIQKTVDNALPGGGGCHWDVDASGKEVAGTRKCTPLNEGKDLDMLWSPIVQGEFPGGAAYEGKETSIGLGTTDIPGIFGNHPKIPGRRVMM